jgi:segregation and condensation protein A
VSTPLQLEFRLQLDSFEGPLELLLNLIEQRHLPITQVSLAQVADQYLAQIHARPELDRDLLADFLAIAARLLLLKSRALLLTDGLSPDPVVEEVATDLAERLATYRVFRAAAEVLRDLEQRSQRTYPSGREPLASAAPLVLAPTSLETLLAAWRRLSSTAPTDTQLELPGVTRASVDERRAVVLDALRLRPRLSFREVAGATIDAVIATFLALLELLRRGEVTLDQPEPFGELVIGRAG